MGENERVGCGLVLSTPQTRSGIDILPVTATMEFMRLGSTLLVVVVLNRFQAGSLQ
jgi:hypothetical protein